MKRNIFILLIVASILIVFSTLIFASGTIDVKGYIKGKLPSIFSFYLSSLEDLDSYEKEFIDLLQKLPEEEQKYYAKEVYKNGFSLELLKEVKDSKKVQIPTSNPPITILPQEKPMEGLPFHFIVASTADSGSGTLRQALIDAQSGDKITFDPTVFPPENPAVIKVLNPLPVIFQGNLTIDASNAGVILDGSQAGGEWTAGIEIDSEKNIIQGLQVVHFSGPGILLNPEARFNIVGGDRNVGLGPIGQGNLFSVTSDGVAIKGSNNVIAGNLIGTDVTGSGSMGNRAPGVFLEENASRNVIGPNNIIAYNGTVGGGGIEIRSMNAQANIITANSIHDNSFPGICYNISDSTQVVYPTIPIIFDFDLASGMVRGITCPDCIVEIFSTSTGDGEIYEGTITADQYGNFSFSKGQGFSGLSLTATSRSFENNTSEFSMPTSGLRNFSILQEGNEALRIRFESKPGGELEDNRIGQLFDKLYLLTDLQGILDNEIIGLGTKYVKLTITEAEPVTMMGENEAPIGWDIPEFSFSPEHEEFITNLAENGITVNYILTFWDKANHPQGWQPNISRFRTQEEIQRYLEYVRFIVNHFKGRVQSYEIWNEPNNKPPLQWIQADDYINLVRQTVPIIRQEDPDAKIVVGSVVLQEQEDRDYLFRILRSDVMPMVDVIAWHPMFGVSPENIQFRTYYYNYPSIIKQIKDTAAAHGFQGDYRADEVLYRSPDCFWCNPGDMLNSNITAAKYYARGIIMNLGMNLGVGVAGTSNSRRESYMVIQNLCTLMAGAKPANIPIEIQSETTNIITYSFYLPNGDRLIALWTDGVAADDDPGTRADLTVPDLISDKLIGIDVLYGFEQQLITNTVDGDLIIRGLLIKDYPIILRLTNITPP